MKALPRIDGGWPCIVADPPWKLITFSEAGQGRSASQHYPVMDLQDIMRLPVAGIAGNDAHLFIWTTATHLPFTFQVMQAWGFEYSSTAFVWVKTRRRFCPVVLRRRPIQERDLHYGLGKTTRKNAEFCLLGRRGKPRRQSMSVFEVIVSKVREHSRKPDESFDRIEQYCEGPRLELFAREARPGWTAWGNEVHKFSSAGGSDGQK